MLTAQQCILMMQHAAGGPLPTGFDALGLMNRVGLFMVSAHNWRWLIRTATVSLVADQQYAALPSSFQKLLATPTFLSGVYLNTGMSLAMVEYERILKARASDAGSSSLPDQFLCSVVSVDSASVITQRLELFPTPSENASISISYRADWTMLTTDTAQVAIPPFLELAFIELCREAAKGIVHEDVAPLDVRLASVMGGVMMMQAKRRDMETQLHVGTLPEQGGIVVDFFAGSVSNPS